MNEMTQKVKFGYYYTIKVAERCKFDCYCCSLHGGCSFSIWLRLSPVRRRTDAWS